VASAPVSPGSGGPLGTDRRGVSWNDAMRMALYGHGGFFHRPGGPATHFRTNAHISPLFAEAVLTLLASVDDALGQPDPIDVVDVGAGHGELVATIGELVVGTSLERRIRLVAVEIAPRPDELGAQIAWTDEAPDSVTGLVIANEWLDNLPVDVVTVGVDGPCRRWVDPSTGAETPAGPIGLRDAAWLTDWWPVADAPVGTRAEIGLARDEAWSRAVAGIDRGIAIAIDYGHLRSERAAGAFASGTLCGHLDGRAVPAVPDGSCDITAHVAIDACAAAGTRAGAGPGVLLRQHEALHRLGLSSRLPDAQMAGSDPARYVAQLRRANQATELLDPDGLGGHWWLIQPVGTELPAAFS
jgi:SAM-dependent MidA family methyltransferase